MSASRLLLALLCALPPLAARGAEGTTEVAFLDELNLLTREAGGWLKTPVPACRSGEDTPIDPRFIWSAIRFVPEEDCAPLTIEKVCARASLAGNQQGGWEWRSEEQSRRFNDIELRKRVFGHAYEYFRAMVGSETVAERCCGRSQLSGAAGGDSGSGERCRKAFRSYELTLVRGLPKDSRLGYSRDRIRESPGRAPSPGGILVSEGMLLNCENEQCVERLLLHELGHACHDSLLLKGTPGLDMAHPSAEDLSVYEHDLRVQLDTAVVGGCAIRALSREADSFRAAGHEVFPANWYEEAFADLIFISYWSDPTHWSWSCRGKTDSVHGPTRAYLACALQIPAVRRKICGPESAQPAGR